MTEGKEAASSLLLKNTKAIKDLLEAHKEELGIKPNQWTPVGDDGRTVWQGSPEDLIKVLVTKVRV